MAESVERKSKRLYRKLNNAALEIQFIYEHCRAALADRNKESVFRGAFRMLDKYHTQFETTWEELVDLEDDIVPDDPKDPKPTFPNESSTKLKEQVRKMMTTCYTTFEEISSRIAGANVSGIQNSTVLNDSRSSDHLPKISLPKYDGHLPKWPAYRDTYLSLVHNDATISDMHKFHHLLSSLTGQALATVKHIPLEESKYRSAWQALLDAYDNKRMLASAYLNQLLNFKPPSTNKCSLDTLKAFVNEVAENIAAFNSLRIEKASDFILFHLAMRGLDQKTREDFEVMHSGMDFPTCGDLTQFVRDRCRALELASANNFTLTEKLPTISSPNEPKRSFHKFGSPKVTSLVSNLNTPSRQQIGANHSKSSTSCPACSEFHSLLKCESFLGASVDQRLEIIRNWHGCRNCLSDAHTTPECGSKWHCKFCPERHSSYLHVPKSFGGHQPTQPSALLSSIENTTTPEPDETINLNTCAPGQSSVLLGTALIRICDARGQYQTVRAVIDSASQHSFITARCLFKLGLKPRPFPKRISGIGQTIFDGAKGQVSCTIKPVIAETPILMTDAIVVSDITSFLPSSPLDVTIRQEFTSYELADPKFWNPAAIQFLLGADLFPDILTGTPIQISQNVPKLVPSIFGHIVMGRFSQSSEAGISLLSGVKESDDLGHLIARFWEIEDVPTAGPSMTQEEQNCEDHFQKTHYRLPSGRYVVFLPFRGDEPIFQDSPRVALKMFHNLEVKLANDPSFKEAYNAFMREYLDLDHMSTTTEQSKFVIPHHGVTKIDRNKVKLRVVFNGSVKLKQGSLNDFLLVGPKLQRDIRNILLNFRAHLIVFVADIVKMYRQILVDPSHRAYLHIYFRFDDSEPILVFVLHTVTYGLTPAPFLALRVIKQLVEDEGHDFPDAAPVLEEDIYVDDVASGAPTVEKALELQHQLIELLKRGGFELSKWASNTPELLHAVATETSPTSKNEPFPISPENDPSIKILGMKWDPTSDAFSYSISEPTLKYTKRAMLSNIAKVYDPLGFLSPSTFLLKSMMQDLWKLKLKWDDKVPENVARMWKTLMDELSHLKNIQIERFIGSKDPYEHHFIGFCDASNKGYCAVIYLRTVTSSGVKLHLLVAKTKVAPVKQISIPRLELCGALLLARLASSLTEFRNKLPPTKLEDVLFSDSTIVLSWLRIPSCQLKTFVGNRITQILEMSSAASWRHVSSEHNAADCGSRGLLPSQLIGQELWWRGPPWLTQPQENWPKCRLVHSQDLPEIKDTTLTLLQHDDFSFFVEWMSRVSSYAKLMRYVAWLKRLIQNKRNRTFQIRGPLKLSELNAASKVCIKHVQKFYFFRQNRAERLMENFAQLNPFIDGEGILRVGGRLDNAHLTYDHKHPVLLPTDAHLTKLMVDHFHRLYLHPGPGLLQALIQTRFWVPALRRLVRERTFLCLRCYKFRAKPHIPKMGDLPSYRVQGGRAFLYVGLDFAGPFVLRESLRRKAALSKAYFCIFVCMTTKAVHLEAVTSLSTDAFLATLSRFTSRRGLPLEVFSDCGSNFLGAARVLGDLGKWFRTTSTQETIERWASQTGFKWLFNPPHSPHFGGLWEAGVRSVKGHIVRVAGDTPMTFEEFTTLLTNIEAVLNSRPLCPLSSDPSENDYLSPGHFLIGAPLLSVPEPTLMDCPENRLSRWQLIKRMGEEIWTRWKREYLSTLQKRVKWTKDRANLEINDLVLLKEKDTSPLYWPTAKIIAVHPGRDGRVRVVTLKTAASEYTRPVSDLIPLLPLKVNPFNPSS